MQRESFYTGAEDLNIQEFYGYPKTKAHVYPYKPTADSNNPVLRGVVLKFGSIFFPRVPGLPALFYKNAGWPKLQDAAGINEVDARYDPVVVPFRPRNEFDNSHMDPAQVQPTESRTGWNFYSIADYHKAYRSGKTTPTAVVEALLPIILRDGEKSSHHSTAWLDSNVMLVKAAAAESTKRWKEGKPLGILDGVPFGAKDEADVQGYYKKKMGSTLNWNNPLDSTSWCVLKWEEVGAILMGKTNMHGER